MTGVVTITIDRVERRNALDLAACESLTAEFRQAADSGARVIVLTGAGPDFCAGADLNMVHDAGMAAALRRLLAIIGDLPQPVIAAVRGAALGAGAQLALACDLRVVAPTARFGIPAAKLGLMVDHSTVQRLALLAGHGPARAMLLAAEELNAEAALRLGLAQRAGDLGDAEEWAEQIALLAPLTLAGHKLSLNRLEGDLSYDAAVVEAHERVWSSADALEGPAAFREHRTPSFEGQ